MAKWQKSYYTDIKDQRQYFVDITMSIFSFDRDKDWLIDSEWPYVHLCILQRRLFLAQKREEALIF